MKHCLNSYSEFLNGVCITHEQNHNYEMFIKVGTRAVSSSSSARAVLNLILNKLSAVAENTVI